MAVVSRGFEQETHFMMLSVPEQSKENNRRQCHLGINWVFVLIMFFHLFELHTSLQHLLGNYKMVNPFSYRNDVRTDFNA